MENTMDEKKGLDFYIKFCQEKDKEIERLKKEKKWLIEKYCQDMAKKGWIDKHRHEVIITREMQQALKE